MKKVSRSFLLFDWDPFSTFDVYFRAVKNFIRFTARYNRPLALVTGTMLLELGPATKAALRRFSYHKDPTAYGFNQITSEHKGKKPVLLLHGRMGKWTDVAVLAEELKKAKLPVFVMDIPSTCTPEEIRNQIKAEILKIKELYKAKFHSDLASVNLVGHSLGGYISYRFLLNEGGVVNKVITIGMPTNESELRWAQKNGCANKLFNVLAKYDAIIDRKCALKRFKPENVVEINAGHLGVLNSEAFSQIVKWLAD